MRDEQDRHTLIAQGTENVKKLVGFLRRQNACRFIKNQDARTAKQRFENFNALLQANRQIFDQTVRINREPIGVG